MNSILGKEIPTEIDKIGKLKIYKGEFDTIPTGNMYGKLNSSITPSKSKLTNNIKEAIIKSRLKDGMTISFHHHFRGGDNILNPVMEIIAEMGFKNLRVFASSLNAIHKPLITHIKNGVVTSLATSGLRGELAEEISRGLLDIPVLFRSHGGRARAIESGDEHIDIAFLGAASSDDYGNSNGSGKAVCGSLGYAIMDAKYADKVIILTDNLVSYPNTPASISQVDVDFVVEIDSIGNPDKIGGKETRFTTNPRDLLIASQCAKVITNSKYFENGFSFQTGSGGASLAVTRYLRKEMLNKNIKASFALGGITKPMVELHEEGLIEKLFDVQSFDKNAALSISKNHNHHEISASYYANPHNKGCITNKLDVIILSALEIDVNFNVNVLTGADGAIRGACGGHSDTAASAKLTIVVAPLLRGRIATVVDKVLNVVTPGESIDILVTDRGIAVNKKYQDMIPDLKNAGLEIFDIKELRNKAQNIAGIPNPINYGDKVVGLIEYRDGTIIDVIKNIID